MGLTIRRTVALAVLPTLAAMAALFPALGEAATINVPATGSTASIQAAVDAASPGDTIVVAPGTYTGPTVNVEKDDITIRGSKAATINAAGNDYGITVGHQDPDGEVPITPECGTANPNYRVRNFTLDGMTIRDADETGIFLMSVDGFHVTGGNYVDNAEYGIFPRCSRDGVIDKNSGGGGEDATIYVGVDDNVLVEGNHLSDGVIGIELEDTENTTVRNNNVTGNVAGIFIIVLPDLPRDSTGPALIENNVVNKNNLPNPFPPVCDGTNGQPPDCEPFFEDLQLLPSGVGILNVGGHGITIRDNVANNNDTVGIGAAFDPITGDTSANTIVTGNVAQQNGKSPDPRTQGSGDLVFLDFPNGSCFSNNVHKTEDFLSVPPPC